jgi:ParB family chromosome partitioning protein
MAQHKALGRGLDALFSSTKTVTKDDVKAAISSAVKIEKTHDVRDIPVDKIKPNRHQPRTHFDQDALQELADSIRTHGVAQPLVVTETASGEEFELVMGERRWRASKLADIPTVPCIVKKLSNRERFELALIENIQRQDLNAMEEAIAIDGLMKEYDLTQEQVAAALGKSRSAVANILRFLRLHDNVQASLRAGEISEGHAKVLAGVSEHSEQLRLLENIIDKNWSVRDLEAQLKGSATGNAVVAVKSPKGRIVTPEIKEYEEDFQRELGRRVEIQTAGKKGWIRFAFYSPWDLDNLCKRLGLLKKDIGENTEPHSDGG